MKLNDENPIDNISKPGSVLESRNSRFDQNQPGARPDSDFVTIPEGSFVISIEGLINACRRPILIKNSPEMEYINYKTRSGVNMFSFVIRMMKANDFRIYIMEQPSYGNRDSGAHATHRLSDGDMRYICWNSQVKTRDQVLAVIAKWSEATENYINTGKGF